jgi:hypothetical protein
LERVEHGERLIVCRHRLPVATLQPLNGVIRQPFDGRDYDVTGSPLGNMSVEVEKLTELEIQLLITSKWDRFVVGRVADVFGWADSVRALEKMRLRGLAERTERGWVPRGRGMMLREELLARGDVAPVWPGRR